MTWQNFLDGISVGGFVLTIVGFGITFRTLRQTKTAAEAAKGAVEDLQKSFSKVDTITILSTVITNIKQIKEFQRNGEWKRVPAIYTDVRMLLAEIQGETSALDVSQRDYVLRANGDFGRFEEDIEVALEGDRHPSNMPYMNHTITGHAEEFTKILADLKRRQETV